MNNNKRIILVHPGRQHSYHLAEALEESGVLYKYITTVYNGKYSLTRFLGLFLGGDVKYRLERRKNEIFDNKVYQTYEFLGLIVLFLRSFTKRLGSKIDSYVHNLVYEKAINIAIKNKVDGIIFYGGVKKKHIIKLKKYNPNIKIIIDVPIVSSKYLRKIVENDINITGDTTIRTEQPQLWNNDYEENYKYICEKADAFLVGSSIVKNSLIEYGTENNKIYIIPYGVDINKFTIKEYKNNKIVRFIFAGTVYRRKGIHHLLPTFERLPRDKENLTLVGSYSDEDPLIKKYKFNPNIIFKGMVTQDKLIELYKESDVFVIPSLGEGLAQVGLEAMNCGLPIICSDASGVNDIVTNGENGFIVPVSNQNALYEAMLWLVNNPKSIQVLGMKAHETARQYSWDFYKKNINITISKIFK